MAYGVTSTTLLLAVGTNPAAASATVHFAEIGTSLMSGLAHWRFGNVDCKVVARIGVPGAVGAFVGANGLAGLSTAVAAPVMSVILVTLGTYILVRFTLRGIDRRNLGKPMRKRFLGPLGLLAGFVDATGGGGWGPVGTPAILASGRMEPRKVIGSIDTSDPGRYTGYALSYAVWAAAVVHSFHQYRKDRAFESDEAITAEAEIQ